MIPGSKFKLVSKDTQLPEFPHFYHWVFGPTLYKMLLYTLKEISIFAPNFKQ